MLNLIHLNLHDHNEMQPIHGHILYDRYDLNDQQNLFYQDKRFTNQPKQTKSKKLNTIKVDFWGPKKKKIDNNKKLNRHLWMASVYYYSEKK
ncbi:hypothetical protein DERP_011960 [Dermatophagoides pteronyssinus]|uniref:Uncharacterized protein n=1 Tax=Dermatophagoides pteronyssinus TaxID=6956 RepID=A0ABQ8J2V9_DERPT|nr:hypothetical protein DERP_011960 [Dermatophagoides pteronyssinus]